MLKIASATRAASPDLTCSARSAPRSAVALGAIARGVTDAPAVAQGTVPFTSAASATARGTVNGQLVAPALFTGDFVQQTFNGPTLPASISSFTLDLRFLDHTENAVPYTFAVFRNGANVGMVAFTSGGGTPTIFHPSYRLLSTNTFAVRNVPLGPGYTVRFEQTSAGIPTGGGSNLLVDGTNASTVTFNGSAVPEPGTWVLLATGLLAIGGGARRRRA